jgi:hypothetical protein
MMTRPGHLAVGEKGVLLIQREQLAYSEAGPFQKPKRVLKCSHRYDANGTHMLKKQAHKETNQFMRSQALSERTGAPNAFMDDESVSCL